MFVFFLDSQNFSIIIMIQTFVWSIICLFTPLVISKITPIPKVMEAWKGKNIWKCFLSPRNPWSIRPTACLLQLSYHVHLFIAIHITWIPYLNVKKKYLHWRGIEPRSPAWQARILPLNHNAWTTITYQKESKTFFSAKIVSGYKAPYLRNLHLLKVSGSAIKCVCSNSLMACLLFSLIVRILV